MSNMMDQNKRGDHKVISIKKVNEISRQKTDYQRLNLDEQQATLQIEVEKTKQQLAALQHQKEKMLHDLKEAIDKEKEQWQETKEAERQEAKKIGYKIGFDEGQEKAVQQYDELLESANKIVQTAKKDYEQTIEKHEKAIVKLAVTAAGKIVHEKIADNDEHFLTIVVNAIKELKDKSNVAIYLHPDDYYFVSKQKEELEQMIEEDETLSIYVDQQLNKGDCIIEHPFGKIDASIDLQLKQIKNALEEKTTEN